MALIESRNRIRSYPFLWDTITTTLLSTIGNGVGLLIPFFIALWFGVTSDTDAFFFSYGLILFFSLTVAPVVESVIVPYIAEARGIESDVAAFVGKVNFADGDSILGDIEVRIGTDEPEALLDSLTSTMKEGEE